jgi:hypothetical protein
MDDFFFCSQCAISILILTIVIKSSWCPVVPLCQYAIVKDNERTNFSPPSMRQLSSDLSHFHEVLMILLLTLCCHSCDMLASESLTSSALAASNCFSVAICWIASSTFALSSSVYAIRSLVLASTIF